MENLTALQAIATTNTMPAFTGGNHDWLRESTACEDMWKHGKNKPATYALRTGMDLFEALKAVPRFVSIAGDTTFAITPKAELWSSVNANGQEHIVNYDSNPSTYFKENTS